MPKILSQNKPHIVPYGHHELRHLGEALDTFHMFLSAFDQSLLQTMAQRHPCSAITSITRLRIWRRWRRKPERREMEVPAQIGRERNWAVEDT